MRPRAVWVVTPVDIETHELGLDLMERHRMGVYDASIISAAMRAGCAAVDSEDMQHGQPSAG